MKRSDVVKVISERLNGYYNVTAQNGYSIDRGILTVKTTSFFENSNKSIADIILTCLEQLGMAPPVTSFDVQIMGCDNQPTSVVKHYDRRWDAEEDANEEIVDKHYCGAV